MRLGAWVDRRGVAGKSWPRWASMSAQLGLHDVSLCAHAQDAGKPFSPFVSASKLGEICRAYDSQGVTPHIMLWPQPNRAHTEAVLRYLSDVHEAAKGTLGSADLDAEEQWTRDKRHKDPAIAAQYREGWPALLPLVVNGITAALPKYTTLVEVADKVFPQAYTSTVKGQTSKPGYRQHAVAQVWRAVLRPEQQLCMGLAAYSQEGAGGHDAQTAMRIAYAAAVAECVTDVRWWQLPNLSTGAPRAFMRSLEG